MAVRPSVATYRLQIRSEFDLRSAVRALPYLEKLGIDTLYLSPLLAARPGSPHGYDVIDPTQADPARGGEQGVRALAHAAHRRGMRLILDIVPNHLAATPENPWWRDVLQRGPRSEFARAFDVDWTPDPGDSSRVVLPVLSRPLDQSVRTGRVALHLGSHALYFDVEGLRYPVGARGTHRFVERVRLRCQGGSESKSSSFSPPRRGQDFRRSILTGMSAPPERRKVVQEVLDEFRRTGPSGRLSKFARDLLNDQVYRLVPYWDDGRVNYRRFFDVNHLIGIRVEDPRVFRQSHARILSWVHQGYLDGLRIDHIDGIVDPTAYLRRLRRALRAGGPRGHVSEAIWVEKILAPSETLPAEWPVNGTTGYDAMSRLTGVFLDPRGAKSLAGTYRWVTQSRQTFDEVGFRAKRKIERELFRSETRRLARRFSELPGRPRRGQVEVRQVGSALNTFTAGLTVYRTYLRPGRVRTPDVLALRRAERRGFRYDSNVRKHLLRRIRRGIESDEPPRELSIERGARLRIQGPWQQWAPAVAAKGIEDTALYRYVPYLALNEVGADPAHYGTSVAEFHEFMIARQSAAPRSLTATTTHDSKWGEDARARLAALTERAKEWNQRIPTWFRWIEERTRSGPDEPRVSRADTYLLLQALLSVRPVDARDAATFADRFRAYAIKAVREAKVRTNWRHPNLAYEAAVSRLATWLLTTQSPSELRHELDQWCRTIAYLGFWNSLATTVLKATVPGIPDVYQGSERSALHFVDPDNRRLVDFPGLERSLERVSSAAGPWSGSKIRGLVRYWWTGNLKLYVTQRSLHFRKEHLQLLTEGAYTPLRKQRGQNFGVLSFARVAGSEWVLVAIGRGLGSRNVSELAPPSGAIWKGSRIVLPDEAPTVWQDGLVSRSALIASGQASRYLSVPSLFETLPFALLYGRSSRRST